MLVIAQNEQKALTCQQQLQSASTDSPLTVRKVYPGCKRFPRHFQAVVIYHMEPSEVNFIKDEIQRYSDAPIKAFFGKTPCSEAQCAVKAQRFTHEQGARELLEWLRS